MCATDETAERAVADREPVPRIANSPKPDVDATNGIDGDL